MSADVWIVTLPQREDVDSSSWACLSADEQARADRFHRPGDRAAYVYSHVALRRLLASRLACAPGSLSFVTAPAGKPYLDRGTFRFNLSRSGDRAVIGMNERFDIGVDTEATVPSADYKQIARREFSSKNVDWIENAPPPERLRRFYRIWAMREALAKAQGLGLAAPASALELEILDEAPQPTARSKWQAHEATAEPDYVTTAVVTPGEGVRWHVMSWQALESATVRGVRP